MTTTTTTELLTTVQTSERYGISRRTLERWRYVGSGPVYVKSGRILRYRAADIERWLSTQVKDPRNP